MSIESEIAGLTESTTKLLNAVNIRKAELDSKVSEATEMAGTATEQADISTTKASDSAASATKSEASAQVAASSVLSQLTAIKTQTEGIRDQALAGLGAADNSMALAELLGHLSYVTDMSLQSVRELMRIDSTLTPQVSNHDLLLEQLAYQATHLAGLAGVIGRAISGGAIALQSGTAAIPSMTSASDLVTGVFFPSAGVIALATAALERLRLTAEGRLGIGTSAPSGLLDVADSKIRIRTAMTPASATASGNQGEIAWDANFVYVCTATNTWRRSALAAW